MEISYSRSGDYLIPNIAMDNQSQGSIGKFGRLRKKFLKENRNGFYNTLILTNGLTEHLIEINRQAKEQLQLLSLQMAQAEGVTEKLKAENQLLWVQRMNNIYHRAEETVLNELIYA